MQAKTSVTFVYDKDDKQKVKQIEEIFGELLGQYYVILDDYPYYHVQDFDHIRQTFNDMENAIENFVKMICGPEET